MLFTLGDVVIRGQSSQGNILISHHPVRCHKARRLCEWLLYSAAEMIILTEVSVVIMQSLIQLW